MLLLLTIIPSARHLLGAKKTRKDYEWMDGYVDGRTDSPLAPQPASSGSTVHSHDSQGP